MVQPLLPGPAGDVADRLAAGRAQQARHVFGAAAALIPPGQPREDLGAQVRQGIGHGPTVPGRTAPRLGARATVLGAAAVVTGALDILD
nr:hypothetical protein GCM10020063_026360 [Dactylosporangium thailandense]